MTIATKVVADSVSPQGIRLTTLQLRYPKFIHGEAKTHRVIRIADRAYETLEEVGFMDDQALSRNASSSRAIPVERMIQDVLDDPAMPVFWGKNQPGMQAAEELSGEERQTAIEAWIAARDDAVFNARRLAALGAHKQLVNRVIESWCHINVVVTATEWTNFFALRRHKDAQPEMRTLADATWDAMQGSTPKSLNPGEWHLPYVTEDELRTSRGPSFDGAPGIMPMMSWKRLIKLSVARCARVSYLTHEGKPPNVEEDLKLYDRLVGSAPLHASPAEHQATPDVQHFKTMGGWAWNNPRQHGNLTGWRQYRKMLPNENVADR